MILNPSETKISFTWTNLRHPMVIFYSHGKTYNNNNYKGPIPKWCNNLIGIYVLSDNLRLTHPLKDVISVINRTHKSPRITPAITSPKCELDRTLEQPTQKRSFWKNFLSYLYNKFI
ncbi:hypothetical protein RirG_228590 [Rhizophagus irregularis DAOM 197198w]|uniref:Uncharacterized protein n=1 Tax=Rhizophagus irregularis (strain DAOM 197198w) TaxID=1432141 RepID=A0A015ID59_RHIIW|nr:hypothetical protein RirG_228590 [Rhizophagus irregularis DAOM 197198w]